jgi:hypothetical protein
MFANLPSAHIYSKSQTVYQERKEWQTSTIKRKDVDVFFSVSAAQLSTA